MAVDETNRRFTVARAGWPARIPVLRRLVLAAMVTGVLLPFVPMLIWSFAFRWTFPNLLPESWSLRAWRYLATPESQVAPALLNSFLLAGAVTVLAALIGTPAGRALGLYRFRGKRLVEFLILAPLLVPAFAVSLGIQIVFIRYGLADSFLGVLLVHLVPTTPYMTLVMASVFANFDREAEDLARTLGATPTQTWRLVTLPAILPGLVVGGLFVFLISWSQYALTLIIGGGRLVTLPMLLFAFARSGDNAVAAALSLVFIAPAIVLLVLTARYLGAQPTAGGIRNL
jgi:putative spermidine/putrescine transport system permease protein